VRLATKIFLVSALVILVLCATVAWSLRTVQRLVTVSQDIATRSVPALRAQGSLRESAQALVRLEARAVVLNDRQYAAAWDERAAQTLRELRDLRSSLETPEEQAAYAEATAAFQTYRQHVADERRLIISGQAAAALHVAEGPAREAALEMDSAVYRMTGATLQALARSQEHARALERRTWRAVTTALLTGLFLALAASAWLAVRMTRRLQRLAVASAALAAGTWPEPLGVEGRDEISALGGSFNRMAERLREVDRLKEEFFSHISHDLRNPLASIRLAAENLQEHARDANDPKQARFAALINVSAARMLTMVNQILDFTRLRARAVPPDRKPTDLLQVVGQAMDELHVLAEEKQVRVDLAVEPGDFSVLGEEGSLVRVVVNLLGNAVTFTPAGGSVRLHLAEVDDHLVLRVEDTGVGIPPEALQSIFEPYHQAHGRRRGTGLGLAVVRGLVEAHDGTVSVRSEMGTGSCFTVTIPKARAGA
jgi:signal transduction histidine kinase